MNANRSVPTVLQMVAEVTGLRFACVARVTETTWTACAVLDTANFGLKPGDEIDVTHTFCGRVRDSRAPLAIDEISSDPGFRHLEEPKLYGIESYIGLPLYRANGEFFGTLCAIDPLAHTVSNAKTMRSMKLLAQLLSQQIDGRPASAADAAVAPGDDFQLLLKPADDLAADLRHVVAELRGNLAARSIDASFDLGRRVLCDRVRIAQLLGHLLRSALAHADPGQTVLVRAVIERETLLIETHSHGPQLPAAMQTRIFHLFHRPAIGLRERDMAAEGAGLYLAAEIARAHGGALTCTSGEHTTTYTFSMPLTNGTQST